MWGNMGNIGLLAGLMYYVHILLPGLTLLYGIHNENALKHHPPHDKDF